MRRRQRKSALPDSLTAELIASAKREGKSFVARPKVLRRSAIAETRIPEPKLPARGLLRKTQQWRSLRWMVDTAQAHGVDALRGLSIALARMIQADAFGVLFLYARPHRSPNGSVDDLLWDRNQPITETGQRLADLLTPRTSRDRLELDATAAITNIWERWRLARALQHLGPFCTWGAWRQDENHHAVVWYPWPLVWIDNGNHSTTAAILKGGGAIRCEASFDATPLLRIVTTDGRRWFGENRRVLGRVRSLPMAGIVEIGRRLVQLKDRRRRFRSAKGSSG